MSAPVAIGGFPQDVDPLRTEDQEILGGDVDIRKIFLDVVKPHVAGFDVRESLTDARVKETMSGAPTLEIDVHDPDWALLKSDVLFVEDKDGDRVVREVWIELEKDRWYELAGVRWGEPDSGRGADLTIIFEHRIVADLRKHRKSKKVSRAKMTRAEFVQTFAREVKLDKIRFISPELHKKQPLANVGRGASQAEKDIHRQPGFGKHDRITIKGGPANETQKKNLDEVLTEGERQGASHKVMVIAVMVVTQESEAKTSATNGDHVGLFQQSKKAGWPATRNPTKDSKEFFKRAIKIDQDLPNVEYATLAEDVQHSGQGDLYAQWKTEAGRTVKAWGGSGSETSRTRYKTYMFQRGIDGKHEDSWTCSQRLADEVNWRSFVSGKTNWYFISEPDLMRSRPRLIVSQEHPAVLTVTGDCDRGKSANTLVVTVRMSKWTAPAGSVVLVKGYGMDGRWLVEDVERSLFDRNGTVTLKKPSKPLPEPRPDTVSEQLAQKGNAARLYEVCKKFSGPYKWGGGHGPTLDKVTFGEGLDCSSSVSKALYESGLFGTRKVAIVSGEFEHYGEPGKGKQFTVWANGEHVWIQFHKLGKFWRFDTSPHGDGANGPRRRKTSRSTAGFVPRHYPGL